MPNRLSLLPNSKNKPNARKLHAGKKKKKKKKKSLSSLTVLKVGIDLW